MGSVSYSSKKFAKMMLLKFLSWGISPDALTRYLLNVMGIEYVKEVEGSEAAFVARYLNGSQGCLCISVDFDNRDERKRAISTKATIELVDLSEEFSIPITWAICGTTAINEDEAFRRIVSSKVGHELAIHTFDHQDFSDPTCDEGSARSQITKTIQILPPSGSPATFVFPWNRYGHFDLLKDEGFIAYRGRKRRLGYPSKISDLWDIHPLVYISEKSYSYSGILKALVDLAITHRALFHLWLHPWNMEAGGDVSKYLSDTLRPLFQHVKSRRQEGKLWLCTLGELANYCEARSNCTLTHFNPEDRSIIIDAKCEIKDDRFNKRQFLTLGVKIPKNGVRELREDGNKIEKGDIMTVEDRDGRMLYVNVFFDKPAKQLYIDLLS